jgi:hypothetical protein
MHVLTAVLAWQTRAMEIIDCPQPLSQSTESQGNRIHRDISSTNPGN